MASDSVLRVIATGFGPFRHHQTNDSWDALQALDIESLEGELNIKLILKEIPVSYEQAELVVQELWAEHQPDLMIHVGIHCDETVNLEYQSFKFDYKLPDVDGKSPQTQQCPCGDQAILCCQLDLQSLLSNVETHGLEVKLSQDPGRYLCAYTYYMSLARDPKRSLFVHIPAPECQAPFSSKVGVLRSVITQLVAQIKLNDQNLCV